MLLFRVLGLDQFRDKHIESFVGADCYSDASVKWSSVYEPPRFSLVSLDPGTPENYDRVEKECGKIDWNFGEDALGILYTIDCD